MSKWYDSWLTNAEKRTAQVSTKGARARNRRNEEQQKDAEKGGYPRSGSWHQRKAAENADAGSVIKSRQSEAANRGYPRSGDSYQKTAAQNADMQRKRQNVNSMLQKLSNRGRR